MLAFSLALSCATEGVTPTKSWSSGGWGRLQWGMGPQDVEPALSSPPTNLKRMLAQSDKTFLCLPKYWDYELAGIPGLRWAGTFVFTDRGLRSIRLQPAPDGGVQGLVTDWRWFDGIEAALTTEYGSPAEKYDLPIRDIADVAAGRSKPMVVWRHGATVTRLLATSGLGQSAIVTLEHNEATSDEAEHPRKAKAPARTAPARPARNATTTVCPKDSDCKTHR